MKKIPVEQAVGMTLCHDITKMVDGFKGAAFKRGHVIREEDVQALLDIGKKTIFVWEEHAGEIHEEDCALRMAAMAAVEGAHYTAPSEGKVLLMADRRGMFRVNTALLEQINALGTTVLVVTHERELVNRFTKRVVAISEGRIISDGMDGYYLNEEE